MIFPIGDDNIERGHSAFFSYGFIGLNLAIHLWIYYVQPDLVEQNLMTYGAIPSEISGGIDMETLLTSMFLHGGWAHVLGNMLYLWLFGDNIEATVGNFRFVIFYLMGGLVAGLTQVMIDPTSDIPCVGASGAIAAVMGAYVVMFPKSRVKMIVLVFFSVFYVPSWVFLGFWFLQQVTSGMGVFDVTGDAGGNVAWWAHIGGFVFGLLAGLYFRGRYPVANDPDIYA